MFWYFQIFKAAGARFARVEDPTASCPQYECITPLRTLLAKERNPERWEQEIEPMETHTKERENSELWQVGISPEHSYSYHKNALQ